MFLILNFGQKSEVFVFVHLFFVQKVLEMAISEPRSLEWGKKTKVLLTIVDLVC